MKDDIGSTPEGSDGEFSLDEDDQLQPEDTLDDRGIDDVLDEGYSPPDYAPKGAVHGLTAREQADGETLDERLAEEEPDVGAVDPLDEITAEERSRTDWRAHDSDTDDEFDTGDEVGDRRAGRLIAPDEGSGIDTEPDAVASDAGIDGAGASAEEAAVHLIPESEREPDGEPER
ncbi:hypothetical protein IA539_19315 [Gordonia sp. zg691]|uniref:DUF5709 domain-containing protein n=1 Tax=Gordonia jinghuaiqii TaxID=2758710 RepID=A0A7D7QI53_9ACTN|nr:DUF5709 domain-containing protein [Gordonia jinghuaiqii]MBD0863325.1 hypothetical protein [Gordonia jinghuaiqii]MCR5980163.1 hypothetical protein [Gordonia jinghuaiqii]QMT03702.1 hypothetical protein H1R19_02515 [Gordonia jinghuaiqii]